MIYALKLLLAVLSVSGLAVFAFRRAFAQLLTPTEYKRAWTVLFLAVTASFICKLPAIFLFAVAAIGLFGATMTRRGPAGKVAVFLLLLVALPPIRLQIGGIGDINYVLSMDHVRTLSLVLLGSAAVELAGLKPPARSSSFLGLDLLIVAYQCLRVGLQIPQSTLTTDARMVVEAVLDVLLPYFVVTRSLRSMADIRFAGAHLLLGLAFAAAVGVAEFALQTNLYSGLQSIYDIRWSLTYSLARGTLLRVQSVSPQPIILAFMMLFGLGLAYWLNGREWRRQAFLMLVAVFVVTLVATISRGQWLACLVLLLAGLAVRYLSSTAVRILVVSVAFVGIGLKLANADNVVISALGALFGSSDVDLSSIEYRRELLDASLALIQQSPWLGVPNYAAQMQSLKQGQGIIDLVNTYVAIMLDVGVIGLTLYLLPFVVVVNRLLTAIGPGKERQSDNATRFATAFSALIIASLFAIFTTSSWGIMPLLLALLIALPVAWLGLSPEERTSAPAAEAEAIAEARRLASRRAFGGGHL